MPGSGALNGTFQCSFNLLGQQVSFKNQFYGGNADIVNAQLPAGKAGTLSTHTTTYSGTLTMAAGHGITTGSRIDIFWTIAGVGYVQRNCLVGTVSGNSVPFTNAANLGDVLPPASTVIVACQPTVFNIFVQTGSPLVAIFCQAQGMCMMDFSTNNDAAINDGTAETFPLALVNAPYAYGWMRGNEAGPAPPTPNGDTSGLEGVNTQAVYVTNGTLNPNTITILPLTPY